MDNESLKVYMSGKSALEEGLSLLLRLTQKCRYTAVIPAEFTSRMMVNHQIDYMAP